MCFFFFSEKALLQELEVALLLKSSDKKSFHFCN